MRMTPDNSFIPADVKAGGYITFGAYPQGANDEAAPIEWLVLDARDGRVLLLSRYGLDTQLYHAAFAGVTWETCSLRAWLNGEFLNAAFTAEERQSILTTDVDNGAAQGFDFTTVLSFAEHTSGGNSTRDKLFLLSCKEAEAYLGVTSGNIRNTASRAVPTAYAIGRGANAAESDKAAAGYWWLRSPGYKQYSAAYVDPSGSLACSFAVFDEGDLVRPALWIKL